jgi:hypothetical protein
MTLFKILIFLPCHEVETLANEHLAGQPL